MDTSLIRALEVLSTAAKDTATALEAVGEELKKHDERLLAHEDMIDALTARIEKLERPTLSLPEKKRG